MSYVYQWDSKIINTDKNRMRATKLIIMDTLGMGGIDKYSTTVFLEKIFQYYYIPTTGVADLQAPLGKMLRSA